MGVIACSGKINKNWLTWDADKVCEIILTKYVRKILIHYSDLIDRFRNHITNRELYHNDISSSYALNNELVAYAPLVLLILKGYCSFETEHLRMHVKWFYPLLIKLIKSRSFEIRMAVIHLMENKMYQLVLPVRSDRNHGSESK